MTYTKGISHSKNLQFIVLYNIRGLCTITITTNHPCATVIHLSQNNSQWESRGRSRLFSTSTTVGLVSMIINITKYNGGEKDQDVTVGWG